MADWIFSSEYFLPYTAQLAAFHFPLSRIQKFRRLIDKAYPFGQKQSGKHGIHAYLGTLRRTQALDEMQLRGLGHGVGHGRSSLGHGCDGARGDEGTAVRVGLEGGFCGFEEGERHFDVGGPALFVGC